MSYYGDDRLPPRARDRNEPVYFSRKPATKRVGAGHRARVTVETGAEDGRYRQEQQLNDAIRRERRAAELEQFKLRRREQLARPTVRLEPPISRIRRNSLPVKTSFSSPALRPSVPASEVQLGGDVDYPGDDQWSPLPTAGRPTADDFTGEPVSQFDDGEDYLEDLDFNLPKVSKIVRIAEDVAFVIPDSDSNDFSEQVQPTKTKFSGPMTELSISRSRWIGNTFERGDLGGEIATISSKLEQTESKPVSMMKWYHLERSSMMSFEEFMAASQSVLKMPEKEQRDVAKLLRDVQKKFEKQRHHGREMEPDCVSDVFYNDATDSTRQTASVMFLSFPYFCLESYSSAPIRALTPGSPMHPARPMLQAHFYSTSRNRELEQAITSMPSTIAGECLHLSQVWCLVVNGSTMVTCSRLSLDALCGETIRQTTASPPEKKTHVKVSAGTDRSWLIPVTPSTSWPQFLAMFGEKVAGMEAQGASAKFEYNREVMDGNLWHDLVETARTSMVELLMRNVRFHVDDADKQIANEETITSEAANAHEIMDGKVHSEEGSASKSDMVAEVSIQPVRPAPSMPHEPNKNLQLFKHIGSTSDMRSLADSLHNVLLTNERTRENEAYKRCPASKANEITTWLASISQQTGREDKSRGALLLRKPKRRIVSVAKYLFCVFWPMDFEHPMTDKFWGALNQILSRRDEFYSQGRIDPKTDVAEAISVYNCLHDEILPLASVLAQEFLTYEKDLQPLPEAFSKAWLHLIMAVILTAQTSLSRSFSFSDSPISKHLHAITDELEAGKREVMARLHSVELEDLEICTESSILALLLNQVARDVMHGCPDVVASYSDYYQSMEFNVTQDPAPRVHQEKIRFFLQEVEAVLATLQNQFSVMEVFQQSLEQQSMDNDAILIYSLGDSRQSVVIEDCKARVGGRIDKFKGLQKRAEDLGEWHRNEMDTNKDRQENAIMIFTIVTIIFLPLSFVSSVFGMNTTDIRDLPYSQWAYWAAGLPLTAVVVVGSLWWAGELEGIGRWLAKTTSRSSGYEKLQESNTGESRWRSRRRRRSQDPGYEEDVEGLPPRPRRRTTYPRKEQ